MTKSQALSRAVQLNLSVFRFLSSPLEGVSSHLLVETIRYLEQSLLLQRQYHADLAALQGLLVEAEDIHAKLSEIEIGGGKEDGMNGTESDNEGGGGGAKRVRSSSVATKAAAATKTIATATATIAAPAVVRSSGGEAFNATVAVPLVVVGVEGDEEEKKIKKNSTKMETGGGGEGGESEEVSSSRRGTGGGAVLVASVAPTNWTAQSNGSGKPYQDLSDRITRTLLRLREIKSPKVSGRDSGGGVGHPQERPTRETQQIASLKEAAIEAFQGFEIRLSRFL